jgi:hypothetical protein
MLPTTFQCVLAATLIGAMAPATLHAGSLDTDTQPGKTNAVWQDDTGLIRAGVQSFDSWKEYFESDFFRNQRGRCGSLGPIDAGNARASTSDCTSSFTNPIGEYDPSTGSLRIPVVVHVITRTNGLGFISDSMVQSQIDVLNEDFLSLPGSPGSPGTDSNIEFYLATVDPDGNSTDGITRSTSNSWYNDRGNYKSSLSWDTNRYLNIYTNTADGYLGYAYIPNSSNVVGTSTDGVVINWQAFGRNSPLEPYDQGRTATHEVGHYLGLYHTFQGGCASASGCYSNGDLICDTTPEGSPNYSGCSRSSCGSSDPVKNYMDYSEDLCMNNFTPDQANRMRCTIENWRPSLCTWDNGGGGDPTGACCAGSSCSEGTEADCLASGGTWQGDGTSCGSTSCGGGGDPTGACCAGSSCSEGTEADCLASGGTWQGDGTSCGSTTCEGGGGDPVDAIVVGATTQIGAGAGGSAADLDASDDSYMSTDAARSGSKYECQVEVSLIAASTSASRIDVRTEVGASTSGSKTRIYIYDHNSGSWDRIISYNQRTSDTVKEANDLSSPSDYVDSSTGEIRVRVYNIKRNGDYVTRIDEVNVTVTP